jgi:hypothetical protein
MINSLTSDGSKPAEEKESASPFIREFFMVQCAGFLGMAYRNSDGKWLDAFNHRQLPDDIRILG